MDFIGKSCPVCQQVFEENDDVVVCPKCGAPYHRECYKEKGKCVFPELHKEKKTWKSVYDNEEKPESNEDDEGVVCKSCGHKNIRGAVICEKCGEFLTGDPASRLRQILLNDSDEDDDQDDDDDDDGTSRSFTSVFPGGAIKLTGFEFSGVRPDEDFDGVTGEEIVKCVGQNSLYYLPIFSRIKNFDTSRFNFAAFFFGPAWYLYRKQYAKGAVIATILFLIRAADFVVTYLYAGALWSKAMSAFNGQEATYMQYADWMRQNCTTTDMIWMLLPYVFGLISWVIMFACGFRANRGYYHFILKKVKKLKEEKKDLEKKEFLELLRAKGGVNPGLAFMLAACEIIMYFAAMFAGQ